MFVDLPYGLFQETLLMLGVDEKIPNGRVKVIGLFLFLLTFLIAFGLGYPILLDFFPQLDPFRFILDQVYLFGAWIGFSILTLPWIVSFLKGPFFFLFLGASAFYSRIWCKICPFEILMSPLNKVSIFKLKINENTCIKCRKCVKSCQMGLNPVTNEINSIYCIRCLNCLELCPANAIKVALRILNG